jgi:hypothetical protein
LSGTREVDLRAEFFAHFADGAGEAASAAVGDGGVQAEVAGLEQDLLSTIFFSVMALPIWTAPLLRTSLSLVSSQRAEGRAVDAVAAGAPADDDDVVALAGGFVDFVARDDADAAAVHEGLPV